MKEDEHPDIETAAGVQQLPETREKHNRRNVAVITAGVAVAAVVAVGTAFGALGKNSDGGGSVEVHASFLDAANETLFPSVVPPLVVVEDASCDYSVNDRICSSDADCACGMACNKSPFLDFSICGCQVNTTSGCDPTSNAPMCFKAYSLSGTRCGCRDDSDCASGQTCGTSWCTVNSAPRCSANHNANCPSTQGTSSSTTAAITGSTTSSTTASSPSLKPSDALVGGSLKPSPVATTAVTTVANTGSSSSTTTTAATGSSSTATTAATGSSSTSSTVAGITGTSCVNIEFLTDNHPEENSFSFLSSDGTVLFEQKTKSMTEANTVYPASICDLEPGEYEFVVTDGFGDGICCTDGNTGKYTVDIDGQVVLVGGRFKSNEVRHGITVGYNANMSEQDQSFLDAHNQRRQKFHELKGVPYRPMAWSPDLAAGASKFVDEAVKTCTTKNAGGPFGFNIANEVIANESLQKPPQNAVTWWASDKWYGDNSTYPANQQFTAVVWRSALYVGCASKTAQMDNSTKWCQITQCRYARTTNCGVDSTNWVNITLDDDPIVCSGFYCPEADANGTLFEGHCHT